ncbi:DUF192 domain-containing protein [Oceanobacillus sp. M65]|uniref:DUF192 domain-containing protein n=1 Tax=Oceanobacillus sp. M65 TaxID=3457435 RepID=UPI003FCD41AC
MNNRIKTKLIYIISGNRKTKLTVQVADTQGKIEKGLMFVGKLPEYEGMLFVFPRKIYGGFWMKDTLIPLSIAFVDSDGKILKILDMEPCKGNECPIYDPKLSYRYAIEVNKGWFEKNRIKERDYVKFN